MKRALLVVLVLVGCNIEKAEENALDWAQDNIGINIQHIDCTPIWFTTAHCEVYTPTESPFVLRCDEDKCLWLDGGKPAW